jgi:hypothetical protein
VTICIFDLIYPYLIFPKLYGVNADEAAEHDIVNENEDLETNKDLIDIINDYGKNRGKYQKGSNKNPVTGTGGKVKEPEDTEEPEGETK